MNTEHLGVVCVVPFWSNSDNMNADSNYVLLRTLLPEMERQSPNTLFVVLFPDPNYGRDKWRYIPDGLQSERIRFVPWPYDTTMRSSIMGFNPVRFREIEDSIAPTLYWLWQIEMGTFMMGGYGQSYNAAARPVLIGQHHYVIHRSLPYPFEHLWPRLLLQIGGSIAADRVVANSRHNLKMVEESFSEFLNHAQVQGILDKTEIFYHSILDGSEPIAPEATEETPVRFVYNHRFESYKRPDLTFSLFDALRHEFEMDVWVTQTPGQMTGGKRSYRFEQTVYQPRRPDYLQTIAIPAINTINSVHETFCIALLDSMAVGHLVVAPNSITFPELVPEGYPYLFNSTDEQKAMIRHILHTWPNEYNKWRLVLAEHARARFGIKENVARWFNLFAAEEAKQRTTIPKDHTQIALDKLFQSMSKGKPYTPYQLQRKMAQFMKIGGTQSFPCRRMVREAMIYNTRSAHRIDVGFDRGTILTRTR